MRSIRTYKLTLCSVFVASGLCVSFANAQSPDNTKVNKGDQNSSAQTADHATNAMSDREMMRHIRHDVVGDKSLSTYGKNVKIIAQHGKVTLKGPVHTEDEKNAIEQYAKKYAGDENVMNQLTIKGDPK